MTAIEQYYTEHFRAPDDSQHLLAHVCRYPTNGNCWQQKEKLGSLHLIFNYSSEQDYQKIQTQLDENVVAYLKSAESTDALTKRLVCSRCADSQRRRERQELLSSLSSSLSSSRASDEYDAHTTNNVDLLDASVSCLCHVQPDAWKKRFSPENTKANNNSAEQSALHAFRNDKQKCALSLRIYANLLAFMGVGIQNVHTGQLTVLGEFSSPSNVQRREKNAEELARTLDLVMISLVQLGFGTYAFELFSFFAKRDEMPEAFRRHWRQQRTVHLLAILVRLNASTLLPAFRAWNERDRTSSATAQLHLFNESVLNALFEKQEQDGGIRVLSDIVANEHLWKSASGNSDDGAVKSKHVPSSSSSSLCSCQLPCATIDLAKSNDGGSGRAHNGNDLSRIAYSAKFAHRSLLVDRANHRTTPTVGAAVLTSTTRKQKAVVRKRKLILKPPSSNRTASLLYTHKSVDSGLAALGEQESADNEQKRRRNVQTNARNSCTFHACIFWRDAVLRCAHFKSVSANSVK